MLVYVLNKDGQPLMPTSRCGKVRRLLKSNKAKVVKRCPFTIQLQYDSTNHTQPITLGVDAGSKTIGVSATTKDKVLYESEVTLRNDIVDLLSTRRQNRIEAGLPKGHYIDARCISGNPSAKPIDNVVYYQKKVRCHNRQIHKCTINKGGYRKLNQASYEVKGFRLFDRVRINNIEGFVFGRRRDGRLAIRLLDGTKLNEQISYKKVIKLENAKYYLTERKTYSAAGASPRSSRG